MAKGQLRDNIFTKSGKGAQLSEWRWIKNWSQMDWCCSLCLHFSLGEFQCMDTRVVGAELARKCNRINSNVITRKVSIVFIIFSMMFTMTT